ncbi:hypothetical protein QBC39DRAFT_389822 [Podospora conica]|nr:hypothetical protein QBC39DRAFT_389822 [Schizothecium conicum]
MDAETLIRTLRAYDASVDATAVRTAFDASQPGHSSSASSSLRDWVARHVGPDTLLSVDELNQFTALDKAGVADKLAASTDLAAAPSFADQEIRDAIDELKRSTETIARQTESLRQQHDALDRLVQGTRRDKEARAGLEAQHLFQWEERRRAVALAVEELSQRLDSRIVELEQQGGVGGSHSQQTADALFRSDDKLLSSLEKLGWELQTEDPEEQDNVVMLRETCARLIKLTVEGLRARLDRLYLEALDSSTRSGATRRLAADEVSALQEELESLYAEILPVAQMSVEQQFLEPALQDLAAKHGQGLSKSEAAIRYMHDCLDYLLDHASELSQRVDAFQGYQAAASALVEVAKSELETKVDLPPAKQDRSTAMTASPIRRQNPIGHGSAVTPLRSRQPPGRRRSSGFGGFGDDAPLDEILRTLAINLAQDDNVPAGTEAQVKVLDATLNERQDKVEDVARNVQESFESIATKQIADSKLAMQLVRDSVLAESPFGQVGLVDPEIEGLVAVLAEEMETVDGKLAAVEGEIVKLRGKSAKRDELVSRWAP